MAETEMNAYIHTSTKVSMDTPFFQLLYNEIMSICLPREKVLVVILQQLITHVHTYGRLVRMCVRTYVQNMYSLTQVLCVQYMVVSAAFGEAA